MTDSLDLQIDRVFGDALLPLGVRMRQAGARLLETELAQDAPSYFVKRQRVSMSKADFESGGCKSPQSVATDLARLWDRPGDYPLMALAPAMAKLARSLRPAQEEAGDISQFVYAMY
jgi:hypothetical protein